MAPPDASHEDRSCRRAKTAGAVAALLVLLLFAYGNSFDASWHFDDEQNIVENKRLHLTELRWETIRQTFFASVDGSGGLYRPVACFSFALNYYFGKDRVFGYHLVNLAVHFLSAVFLFLLLCRSLRLPLLQDRYGDRAEAVALLATLLWALNPVQTQAVTYIVQRMASLAGMFTVMGLYCYLRGRTSESRRAKAAFYLACAACGILGVGSKENAVMLPFSILLFDLMLVQGASKSSVKRLLKALPAVLLLALAAVLILQGPSFFKFGFLTAGYEHRGFTLAERLLTQPRIVVFYISQLLYPSPDRLSIVHTVEPSQGLFDPPETAASILAILALIGAAAAGARRYPLFSFAVFFFFLNHLVESSVIPLELVFEHRNYIPAMFFFVPVAILIVGAARAASRKWITRLVYGACAVLVVSLAFGTLARNAVWQAEESLWLDAVSKHPRSARAYHNLGRAYAQAGRYREAIYAYHMALNRSERTHGEKRHVTYYNLAVLYSEIGDAKAAEQHLRKSLEIRPGYADALTNLAVIVAVQGRYQEAEALLRRAIRSKKRLQPAYTNLGYVLIKQKRYQEAVDWLNRSLEMNPEDPLAWNSLGLAYKHRGLYPEAAACFRQALDLSPRFFTVRLHLAETQLKMGDAAAARQTLAADLAEMTPAQIGEKLSIFDRPSSFDEIPDKDLLLPLIEDLIKDRTGGA